MNLIEKKVLNTIKKYSMFTPGDTVLIAFSGGYDSTGMTLILNNLSDILKIKLYIAHLNHSIRGAESDDDEKFVVKIGRNLNIDVITEKINVPALKSKNKKFSLEEIARAERYKFLRNSALKVGANKIATAHTFDDQIENFILAFLNGRGVSSLAGIPPVNDNIVRPVIECNKIELKNYLQENKIEARKDSSNDDLRIPRNWVRHKLINFIKDKYPDFTKSVIKSINILQEENHYIERIVDEFFEKNGFSKKGIYKLIFNERLQMLEKPILHRVVNRILRKLGNKKYGYEEINLLSEAINGNKNHFELYDFIYIKWNNYNIFTKKEYITPYSFVIKEGESRLIEPLHLKVNFDISDTGDILKNDLIHLRPNKTTRIKIRSRLSGDKIRLMNTDYYTSLKEIFIDLKIPLPLRDLIPIIEINNEVAAIFLNIFPIKLKNKVSENYKVLDNAKKSIKLWFKEME